MNYNFRFKSLISKILASVIALLGFGCSSDEDPEDNYVCMYGAPTGSFTIKGKVSTEDGGSVKDATLRVTIPELPSVPYTMLEKKSGENGEFSLTGGSTREKLKVVCIPENEDINPDSTLVDLKYVLNKNEHTSFWYIGEAEATVNFVLKKKDNK